MSDFDHDNPFAMLGVEAKMDIDPDELQRAFVMASAAVHPDRATDPEQQMELAGKAAAINAAYQQLREPAARAEALLAVRGGATASQDKSLPDGLLMDMLEVRERMEQAQAANDAAQLDEMRQWAEREQSRYLATVADLLEGGSGSPGDDALAKAREQLNALRYIHRMIEQLDPDYNPADDAP